VGRTTSPTHLSDCGPLSVTGWVRTPNPKAHLQGATLEPNDNTRMLHAPDAARRTATVTPTSQRRLRSQPEVGRMIEFRMSEGATRRHPQPSRRNALQLLSQTTSFADDPPGLVTLNWAPPSARNRSWPHQLGDADRNHECENLKAGGLVPRPWQAGLEGHHSFDTSTNRPLPEQPGRVP
jgi:hypothetical protein